MPKIGLPSAGGKQRISRADCSSNIHGTGNSCDQHWPAAFGTSNQWSPTGPQWSPMDLSGEHPIFQWTALDFSGSAFTLRPTSQLTFTPKIILSCGYHTLTEITWAFLSTRLGAADATNLHQPRSCGAGRL
ncbi:hypothetical protein B0H17DRAFT_1128340 [Mycena rosella]|uniref:Uncharacterized protein n=1 Tax=Mycena rosella TaxID=1033263 RepID=A0AAD7DWP8_MYCRO|nr:hypothetical protein B0H17DRAFT_1128340 [Mycena rosella]